MNKSFFSQISTKPSKNALKWAGQEHSILSNVILWALWFCRVLSLLQISKFVFRKIITFFKKDTTDKKSTRPNVPPMFCEIYFILWFVLLILAHIFKWNNIVLSVCITYYLFESIVWVLYYTVFRRFFEENYSIYHELEYLTVLMLVIPTQALGFANLYGTTFREALSGLLGVGSDASPFPVKILGALFAAIVISMIISAFPAEAIKKRNKKQKMLIIGNGDVVKNRLYPALLSTGSAESDIHIFDKGEPNKSDDKCNCLLTEKEIIDAAVSKVDQKSAIFIETPTYTHFLYLNKFIEKKVPLIVVEKPIAAKLSELIEIEKIIADSNKRERIFFLSYYILEKALPLYYLTSNNRLYEKYLDIDDSLALHNWRLRLGILKTVHIEIIEGADSREWTFKKENGGQLLETFIHNALITSLFCGLPSSWKNQKLNNQDLNTVTLTAESGKADISLKLIKNAAENEISRTANFVFSGGNITADFDKKEAKIYFDDIGKDITIAVKDSFNDKYSILVDLVKGVIDGDYTTEEVDGLKNQIEVIKWLIKFNNTSNN